MRTVICLITALLFVLAPAKLSLARGFGGFVARPVRTPRMPSVRPRISPQRIPVNRAPSMAMPNLSASRIPVARTPAIRMPNIPPAAVGATRAGSFGMRQHPRTSIAGTRRPAMHIPNIGEPHAAVRQASALHMPTVGAGMAAVVSTPPRTVVEASTNRGPAFGAGTNMVRDGGFTIGEFGGSRAPLVARENAGLDFIVAGPRARFGEAVAAGAAPAPAEPPKQLSTADTLYSSGKAAGQNQRGYSLADLHRRGEAVRSAVATRGGNLNWPARRWAVGNAWHAPSWTEMRRWFAYDRPAVYFDYGNTIVVAGDSVLQDDQPAVTVEDYFKQAGELADSGKDKASDDDEWMPLGVFALVQDDQTNPTMIAQLAVNREGVLGGTFLNTGISTDKRPVFGAIDKETQRVALRVADNLDAVAETGLYNLTKDEAPCLVHFAEEGRTEQWILVRLDETKPAAKEPETLKPAAKDAPATE